MISLALRRVVLTDKLQLVQRPMFLFRHEPFSMLSSLAPQTTLLDTNSTHSTRISQMNLVPHRTIYDASLLDIASLDTHQTNTRQILDKDKETCISRIKGYIETGDSGCLLLEDMIHLIGLAETEQHLDLIEGFIQLMKDKVDLVGWSVVLMRLYYKMGQVDRAFNNMMDNDKFGQVFNSYTSYRILCTMLFDEGRYDDVIKLYHRATETLMSRNSLSTPGQYPGLAIIALASLAKSDLPDALSKAESIYSTLDFRTSFNYSEIRMVAFLAYIAIKNNQYATALNTIATTPGKNYVSLRELKTLALVKLNRFEDILHHIRNALQIAEGKGIILPAHFELVEEKLGEIENDRVQEEMTELLVKIKKDNLLITQTSLEDMLFAKLISKPRPPNERRPRDSFNNKQERYEQNYNSRRQHDSRRPNQQRFSRDQPKSYLDEGKMDFNY